MKAKTRASAIVASMLILYALLSAAQAVQPLLQPRQTFVDASGLPCAGCSLYSYAAGTTTPLATYTDAPEASQNTNPIVLDASGGAQIWMGNNAYKFILKNALGVTVWSVDNVSAIVTGSFFPSIGGRYAPRAIVEGQIQANEWQNPVNSGNNGIALSLTQCASLPYACQILAPALYAQTEVPPWAYWSYTQNSAITQSASLLDQRFGGNYWASANPYTLFPSASNGNIYSGFSLHTIYAKNPGGTPIFANYYGTQIDAYHTQGGNEQMTFGGGQSTLNALALNATRNTAEAGAIQLINAGIWAPGDFEATSIHMSGPGGMVNAADEGVMYHSDTNDETPNVPEGTVASVSGNTVTATLTAGANTQGEYRFLMRIGSGTTVVPTNITAQVGSPILGSTYGYFSTMTFSSVPTDGAWGTITQSVTSPGAHTVTFTTASGTAAANTLTCIASEQANGLGYYDEIYPSSVSGGFTASFSHLQPSGAVWFQGGDCGLKAELVADTVPIGTTWSFGEGAPVTTYPVRYPWADLGSIDGTNDLFATITNTGNVTGAVGFGTRWGLGSPPATENVILYPGLQVINVAGANGDTTDGKFTFNVPASTEGFAASQTFEEAQTAVQAHGAGYQASSQYGPFGYQIGLERDYYGRYSGWGDVQFNHVPIASYNYTPLGSSTPSGGTDQMPGWAYACTGVWGSCLFYNPFPGTAQTNSIISWITGGTTETPLLRPVNTGSWLGSAFTYAHNNGNPEWRFWLANSSSTSPEAGITRYGVQVYENNLDVFPRFSLVPYTASSTHYEGVAWSQVADLLDAYNPSASNWGEMLFISNVPNDGSAPTNPDYMFDKNHIWLASNRTICWGTTNPLAGNPATTPTPAVCLGQVSGALTDGSGNPIITVPVADTPYNNPSFACPGGQHVSGLNIVNGVIVAAPTCS